MSRTPTPQQTAVIDAVKKHKMVKVEACAGGGKTSTLQMTAEAVPDPSLYLAFNKVTAVEAAQKFPGHVTCKTTHAMAYASYGRMLANKMSRPKGKYVNVAGTSSEVARFFYIDPIAFDEDTMVSSNFLGLLVRKTVALFEQSADTAIKKHHVPTKELKEKLHDNATNIGIVVDRVLKYADKLWDARTDSNSVVQATHDTYLKLYQLSKPVFNGYSVLYVDEFQDTTPCVLDIVLNQKKHMKIVMVGDAKQAIYGWRGAVNAMELVKCESRGLTKSFRYGQAIADVATTVLERAMVIQGNDAINSVVGLDKVVDKTQPYTRLFRTNAALLSAAVEEIQKGKHKVSIEIDVKDFVKFLQSAVALYQGDKKNVKHDGIIPYNDWDELLEESSHDASLGRVAKVVKEGQAARWINILETHYNPENPHIRFITAHKSKGREFDQVIVESDFKSPFNDDGDWVGLSTEEQCLLYVTLTRAILRLEYNQTTQDYLNRALSQEV
jgi:hypothetical protein